MATISKDLTLDPSLNTKNPGSQEANVEQPRFSQREKFLTMMGVLMVMLLASLDQTIVSTAMPRIITDFHGLSQYTWVTTAYLLTSTVMVPIYGKLSDLFGRKSIFLIGVVLFLIGSAASGAAQNMTQLILFRAFQGLGAAALMPIALAVVGDLFTPRERGKWQGVTTSVFGLSSILGPAIGGWITDNATWRWVFYVNIPVGLVALLVLIFLMPSLYSKADKKVTIDYLGAAMLIAGTVPMLLALTWGGNDYAWNSPQIIGLLAFSVITLISFFFYEAYLERHNAQPIIDPSLFKNSIFTVSSLVTMITSMGMFGSIFFLPLFAQGVIGISATGSGFLLSPMMLGLIITSIISGQLVSRFGKYKWIAIVGMLITIGGSLLLLRLNANSVSIDLTIAMIVFGIGLGAGMSIYTLAVQNALPNKIGQATSTLTFFRSIGSTIALAAMGSIMNTAYKPAFHDALNKTLPETFKNSAFAPGISKLRNSLDNPNILLSHDIQVALHQTVMRFPNGQALYDALLNSVKIGLTQGIHNIFFLSMILMIIGLGTVLFLKEIPLRGSTKRVATDSLTTIAEDSETNPIALH